MRVCSVHGCPEISEATRCPRHRRVADSERGTATQRGYNSAGHRRFRDAVLDRDPICVGCSRAQSTVADHYPRSRRELEESGLDPNDPEYGRGLCAPCHNAATAVNQPGGWNDRL